jgi:hypothetical protein
VKDVGEMEGGINSFLCEDIGSIMFEIIPDGCELKK